MPARELYVSSLFSKSRAWAERAGDDWYILSAKHGLVAPDQELAPYDLALRNLDQKERARWAARVNRAVAKIARPGDRIILLAGRSYSVPLQDLLEDSDYRVETPMAGMGIGRRLQWLSRRLLVAPQLERDLDRLYEILEVAARPTLGPQRLADLGPRPPMPRQGVYFFFQPGESRAGGLDARVVRVGTHAVSAGSQSTLWTRLRTHRGVAAGGGNHRSSIFRTHVGEAIMNRDQTLDGCPRWTDQKARPADIGTSEATLERAVSQVIRAMPVVVVGVDGESGPQSDRAVIERNAVGLLSSVGRITDPPSADWLGAASPRSEIRGSGLWNLDHLEYPYNRKFLDLLHRYATAKTHNGD